MQLKNYTDYSLRTLIYLAINPDRLVTIAEVAQVFGLSRNHLMKVAQQLANCGYVRSVSGKNGGMTLARPPETISLGEVVRRMEGGFDLVECFSARKNTCCIQPACLLQGIFRQAMDQFLASLDRHTLQDILKNQEALAGLTTAAGSSVSWNQVIAIPESKVNAEPP